MAAGICSHSDTVALVMSGDAVRVTVGISVHPKGVPLDSVLDSVQACQDSLNHFFMGIFSVHIDIVMPKAPPKKTIGKHG